MGKRVWIQNGNGTKLAASATSNGVLNHVVTAGYRRSWTLFIILILMAVFTFVATPRATAATSSVVTSHVHAYREQRNSWGVAVPPMQASSGCIMNSTAAGPASDGNTALDGSIFLGTGSGCTNTVYNSTATAIEGINTSFWEQSGPVPDETPMFDPYTFTTIPSTTSTTNQWAYWGGWQPGTGTGQPPINSATGQPMPYYGVPNGGTSTAMQQQDPTSIGPSGACATFSSNAGLGYPTPVPTPSGVPGLSDSGITASSGPAVHGVCFDGSTPTASGIWDTATSLSSDLMEWPWNDNGVVGPGCSASAQQCLDWVEYDMSWAMHNYGSGVTPGNYAYGLPVLQPLPYQLPSNFLSLTYNQQMFVAIDTWLIDYGQYPFVAMSNTLNQAAQSAAAAAADPPITPWPGNSNYNATGYAPYSGETSNPSSPWLNAAGYASSVDYNMGGVWIGNASNPVSDLMAFLYQDGWDTQINNSPNLDCTSSTDFGCWGHTRNLVDPTLPQAQSVTSPSSIDYTNYANNIVNPPQTCASMFCVMGVGSTQNSNGILSNGQVWTGPGTSVLMEDWPAPPNPSDISFTFAQEVPYLPADEQAVVDHLLWWAAPQLSVGGAQAMIAGTTGTSTTGTSTGTTGTSTGSGSCSGVIQPSLLCGSGTGQSNPTKPPSTSNPTSGQGNQPSANPSAQVQGQVTGSIQDLVANPKGPGYWVVGANGSVAAAGGAANEGSLPTIGVVPAAPVVGLAPDPKSSGYWMVGADGGVYAFGGAPYLGSVPGALHGGQPAAPIVGIAPTGNGQGYWMVGADGGVYAFGNAPFLGSVPGVLGHAAAAPVTAIVPTANGQGYWLVGADGGVFAFGNATFHGSVPGALGPGRLPAAPIVGMVATPGGQGYWMVGADGGVYSFGNAPFLGSLPGLGIRLPWNDPVVSVAPTSNGQGYWVITRGNQLYTFGNAVAAGT